MISPSRHYSPRLKSIEFDAPRYYEPLCCCNSFIFRTGFTITLCMVYSWRLFWHSCSCQWIHHLNWQLLSVQVNILLIWFFAGWCNGNKIAFSTPMELAILFSTLISILDWMIIWTRYPIYNHITIQSKPPRPLLVQHKTSHHSNQVSFKNGYDYSV